MKLSGNNEIGSLWGRMVELDSLITHLWNVDKLYVDIIIICLKIIALGYRWRIVLIVVDIAWWLGELNLIGCMSLIMMNGIIYQICVLIEHLYDRCLYT